MPALDDYIYSMEAVEDTGDGETIAPVPSVAASGVSGVVGTVAAPVPDVAASAFWAAACRAQAALPEVRGTTDGWHPAWGTVDAPAPTVAGTARLQSASLIPAPSPFALGYAGGAGAPQAPLPQLRGDSGLSTAGDGQCLAPLPLAESLLCAVDNPIANNLAPSKVVALLNRGSDFLTLLAGQLTDRDDSHDAKAYAVLYAVSHLVSYAGDTGLGDSWCCAVATWLRAYGDCEDGAILIHALSLAAGVPAARLRTCFGTYGVDALGHAWCIYQRESDSEWVPLDWTAGPVSWTGTVDALARMTDLTASYRTVDHLLTESDFFALSSLAFETLVTPLRADAQVTALPAEVAGSTVTSAKSVMTAPTARVGAASGAVVLCLAPMPQGSAGGCQTSEGQALAVVPLPSVAVCCGGQGVAVAPLASGLGGCGNPARSWLAAPLPVVEGSGGQASVAWGRCLTPTPRLAALALSGRLAGGVCLAPLPRLASVALAPLAANGRCLGPVPRLGAAGAIVCEGEGRVVAFLPEIAATGHGLPVWAARLWEFDPGRLA